MSSRLISKHNTSYNLKNLLTTCVYLGFIKITVSDGIKLIFVFIKSYFIELYDIYGSRLIYGNYSPFSFITSQEIPMLIGKDRHLRKLEYTGKTNKDYYLVCNELNDGETDYRGLFKTGEDDPRKLIYKEETSKEHYSALKKVLKDLEQKKLEQQELERQEGWQEVQKSRRLKTRTHPGYTKISKIGENPRLLSTH